MHRLKSAIEVSQLDWRHVKDVIWVMLLFVGYDNLPSHLEVGLVPRCIAFAIKSLRNSIDNRS